MRRRLRSASAANVSVTCEYIPYLEYNCQAYSVAGGKIAAVEADGVLLVAQCADRIDPRRGERWDHICDKRDQDQNACFHTRQDQFRDRSRLRPKGSRL